MNAGLHFNGKAPAVIGARMQSTLNPFADVYILLLDLLAEREVIL
jgi:hypothetical protein